MEESLQDIGIKHGTDKTDFAHTFNGKSYMYWYDDLFATIRDDKIAMLEIGVGGGCSLRTWREYFKRGKIVGLDISPDCAAHSSDRIDVFTGSQIDKSVLAAIVMDNPGGFDIVIDDGSHITDHILFSFEAMFPHVKSGGWYVMEDLANTHRDLTEDIKGWHGMHLNPADTNYKNRRYMLDGFILQKIRDMDCLRGDIESIVVLSQMIAIKKC